MLDSTGFYFQNALLFSGSASEPAVALTVHPNPLGTLGCVGVGISA